MARPRRLAHRVIVSLDDRTFEALSDIAGAENKAVATLIRETLIANLEQLQATAQIIRLVKADRLDEASDLAKQTLEKAGLKAIEGQKSFLDDIENAKRS